MATFKKKANFIHLKKKLIFNFLKEQHFQI